MSRSSLSIPAPQRPARIRRSAAAAWAVSLVLHAALFGGFAIKQFGRAPMQSRKTVPIFTVQQVSRIIESNPVVSKPKIAQSDNFSIRPEVDAQVPLELLREKTNQSEALKSLQEIETSEHLSVENLFAFEQTEFFGQSTAKRKICFVVDASGSMQGLFTRVKRALGESLMSLEQDQYFYVLFFSGQTLFESGNGRMQRASSGAISDALDFIDTVRPAGTTEALKALARAMQIRDGSGRPAEQIYFLTDGLDVTGSGRATLPVLVRQAANRYAPHTVIHCIGFWTDQEDQKTLRLIAEQSGGVFKNVED